MPLRPHGLRVEHLDCALGLTEPRPRLSWRLPEGTRAQEAYRLRAGDWDSGRIGSDRQLLVSYEGPPLRSRQRLDWTVKVWTDAGETEWADPARFEMGLLDRADWVAKWIGPSEDSPGSPNPAWHLRSTISVGGAGVERARIYATAQGIYELFVNGTRLGDLELTPGWTSYWSTFQVQAYDITDFLQAGDNTVGAVLSDGWYRGQLGGHRISEVYGRSVALLAQIEVDLEGGDRIVTGTGAGWQAQAGPIISADLMEGETVDLRREDPEWCTPAARLGDWIPVSVADLDGRALVSSPSPPVRRIEELTPISVVAAGSGTHIVDVGQNINGWVRLNRLGPEGTATRLTFAEGLEPEGDLAEAPFLAWRDETAEPQGHVGSPFQVDEVISAGRDGAGFEPRHTVHGFRFVRVECGPEGLSPDDVTGVVVHTDLRRVGTFRSSDDRLNRLHDAATWSFRDNACDVPTDCPTRERLGWTGDWQLFIESAAFLFDVAGLSYKWLRDLAIEQMADGRVRNIVPTPGSLEIGPKGPPSSAAGWGDAAVIVPWQLYRAYGDREILERQWDSMVAWVEFEAASARSGRHPTRENGRPEPAPHEQFVWDTGFHFGEWLEPGAMGDGSPDAIAALFRRLLDADPGPIATAYLCHSSELLSRIAGVLGRTHAASRYRDLAGAVRSAWQAEFLGRGGRLVSENQADYVRALAFGLAPEDVRPALARRLVELVRDKGTHLGTGFLATPFLLPVLADTGHIDVAYELLFQDTEPSWLTMIDRGATTVWELWDGIGGDGTVRESLNHYSKGAVISFLHRYVGGIRLQDDHPAFRRFTVAPVPGGGLTSVQVSHESPYGLIECSWRMDGGFQLELSVPPGTVADVRLPDGQCLEQGPGRRTYGR